jgi:hypothetical protein
MIALSVANAVAVLVAVSAVAADVPAVAVAVAVPLLPAVDVVVGSWYGLSSYSLTRRRGARGAKMSEKVRGVGVITAIT